MKKPEPARLDLSIYPHTLEITTRFGDMDINHHLNNVAYARFFEEARVTFNRGLLVGPDGHRLPELKDFRIMVAAIQISYLREGHYGPPVKIGIGISRIGNNSFEMAAAAFQEGVCIATHDAVIAARASAGGLPDPLKEKFKAWMLRM
ncbi:MAG: acyl-CoA thioesterase [Alphaproteobacteria bacterium]|nr:acyl-CoA thioesterase [Alphaproteobacteria bacterium]